jgi:hypothetical protein
MTQDERYLKEKVASACQQAKWREYRSYPKLLEVLCKLYSKEYLVEHEKEIKGYVDACAKYHGTFDFAAHFSHDLPKGGGGYDSREMIAMPNPPSNGASNSPRPSHDDLAGLNYTHLIKNPEEPPISEKMQCGPQLDFFPQATMSEYTEVHTLSFRNGWHGTKFFCRRLLGNQSGHGVLGTNAIYLLYVERPVRNIPGSLSERHRSLKRR